MGALIRGIERMGPGTGGYDASIVDNLRDRLRIRFTLPDSVQGLRLRV